MKTMFAIAAAAATLLVVPATAQDGDDYRFTLVNKSAVHAIEFVTQRPNGSWSRNWLSTPIKPADKRALVFAGWDERCEVRTRIGFSDGSEFDTKVNYCGVTQVIATDDTLYSR